MKNRVLPYFLNIGVLEVTANDFEYGSFAFDEAFAEMVTVDFPSEQLVGKQAEFLFEQLMKHSSQYTLLASNIQIQGKTETIGELDYLVQHIETQVIYHIELACKWYLMDKSLGTHLEAQWIGPNRKDRLSDKLKKLRGKQFPLLYRAETQTTLQNLSIDTTSILQQLCLKAFLFVPLTYDINLLPATYRNCVTGHHLHASECNILDRTARYAFPKKKEWLLPVEASHVWVSHSEALQIIETFLAERWSPMMYVKTSSSVRTYFVVWW